MSGSEWPYLDSPTPIRGSGTGLLVPELARTTGGSIGSTKTTPPIIGVTMRCMYRRMALATGAGLAAVVIAGCSSQAGQESLQDVAPTQAAPSMAAPSASIPLEYPSEPTSAQPTPATTSAPGTVPRKSAAPERTRQAPPPSGLQVYTASWWAQKDRVVGGCTIVAHPRPQPSDQNTVCEGRELEENALAGVNLSNANLSYATFEGVRMTSATLSGAVLRGALFLSSDLRRADLRNTDLRSLSQAFNNAKLDGANLRGAKTDASTYDALDEASMDEATICPDGRHAVMTPVYIAAKCPGHYSIN